MKSEQQKLARKTAKKLQEEGLLTTYEKDVRDATEAIIRDALFKCIQAFFIEAAQPTKAGWHIEDRGGLRVPVKDNDPPAWASGEPPSWYTGGKARAGIEPMV
jgi:hypothetical protein